MDLRHQSKALCVIMLGEKTHTYVVCNERREFHTSHWKIPTQQKMKLRSHTAEYLFMLPSDWLEFETELNSLS